MIKITQLIKICLPQFCPKCIHRSLSVEKRSKKSYRYKISGKLFYFSLISNIYIKQGQFECFGRQLENIVTSSFDWLKIYFLSLKMIFQSFFNRVINLSYQKFKNINQSRIIHNKNCNKIIITFFRNRRSRSV